MRLDCATCCIAQEAAQLVGRKIAELCLSKDIDKVAFDRGGHIYHGRIKASSRKRYTLVVSSVVIAAGAAGAMAYLSLHGLQMHCNIFVYSPSFLCRPWLRQRVRVVSTSEEQLRTCTLQ